MSISKLLMTAAVCTMSMAAVSTSYGATAASTNSFTAGDDTPAAADTPSRASLVALDSARWGGVSTGRAHRDRDTMSVGSSMSTISQDRLAPSLKTLVELLKRVPREVAFPDGKVKTAVVGAKATQLDIILTGCTNLVDAYNGFAIIAREGKEAQDGLARVLARGKGEKVDVSEGTVEGQIVAAMAIKEAAIAAQALAIKTAEASTKRWKASTAITSGILFAIVGVLANIMKTHGWAIIWGSK